MDIFCSEGGNIPPFIHSLSHSSTHCLIPTTRGLSQRSTDSTVSYKPILWSIKKVHEQFKLANE